MNRVALRQDVLDRAILQAIAEALDPTVVGRAVETAVARLAKRQREHTDRRAQVGQELVQV